MLSKSGIRLPLHDQDGRNLLLARLQQAFEGQQLVIDRNLHGAGRRTSGQEAGGDRSRSERSRLLRRRVGKQAEVQPGQEEKGDEEQEVFEDNFEKEKRSGPFPRRRGRTADRERDRGRTVEIRQEDAELPVLQTILRGQARGQPPTLFLLQGLPLQKT